MMLGSDTDKRRSPVACAQNSGGHCEVFFPEV